MKYDYLQSIHVSDDCLVKGFGITKVSIFAFFIVLFNLLTRGSSISIIVTLPEYAFVIGLILTNHIDKAFFYHMVFLVCSVGGTTEEAVNFSYAAMKLMGPIGISYIINVFFFLVTLKKKSQLPKKSLFSKLLSLLLYLGITGLCIGLMGLVINPHYSLNDFIGYNVYIWIIFILAYTAKQLYSPQLVRMFFDNMIPMMITSIWATFAAYLLGVRTTYSVLEGLSLRPLFLYFSCVFITSLLYIKKSSIVVFSFLLLTFILLSNLSGKEVFLLFIALVVLLYQTYIEKHTGNYNLYQHSLKLKISRKIVLVLSVCMVLLGPFFLASVGQMTIYKFSSALTIVSGDLSEISSSPYIRVATILNLIDEGINNPLILFFGNGYGGYFTDNLGLFKGLDLSEGAFRDEMISSGCFSYAHDTYAAVPLLNGFIGLFLILALGLKYLRRAPLNPYACAAAPWLLFTFYYSTQIGMTGVLLLFAYEAYPVLKK